MHTFLRRSVVFFLAALALAATMPASGNAQADLAGEWVISIGTSDFGNSPEPDSAFLSIEFAGDKLVMTEVRYLGTHGVRNTWYDMPIDGEIHPVKTDDGEFDSTASWDEETLVIWRVGESNVGEIELSERLSLQGGGATLVVDREIEVPGMGQFYQLVEYTRKE
jgi:hypothetical protein